MPLGAAKKPMMLFLFIFLFLAMVMPFFVLIMETFQITTGAGYGLDNLTLYNWIGTTDAAVKYTNYPGIFRNPEFMSCPLYPSPSPRARTRSRMPSSA